MVMMRVIDDGVGADDGGSNMMMVMMAMMRAVMMAKMMAMMRAVMMTMAMIMTAMMMANAMIMMTNHIHYTKLAYYIGLFFATVTKLTHQHNDKMSMNQFYLMTL